jgi:hypothetical protein
LKRLFVIVITATAITTITAAADVLWQTANQLTVAWDPPATLKDDLPIPPGSTLQYQLYLRTDPAGQPTKTGQPTAGTTATVTFTTEGRFDIGVSTLRLVDGQLVNESDIAWSNDASAVDAGIIFGVVYYSATSNAVRLRMTQPAK